jgi:hypothetical protein
LLRHRRNEHAKSDKIKAFKKKLSYPGEDTLYIPTIVSRSMCDYRRRLYWWIHLLITYTHDLELQTITAPLLISTIYKSPKHPLSLFQPAVSPPAVSWQRLLTVEILQLRALKSSLHRFPYRTPSQLSQSQRYATTDGQSVSLSWCQAPIWDLRPDFLFWQLRVCSCGAPSLTRGRVCLIQCSIYLHFTRYYMKVFNTIYTRLLSVQAQYRRSCPIFSSFRLWILVVILLYEI